MNALAEQSSGTYLALQALAFFCLGLIDCDVLQVLITLRPSGLPLRAQLRQLVCQLGGARLRKRICHISLLLGGLQLPYLLLSYTQLLLSLCL